MAIHSTATNHSRGVNTTLQQAIKALLTEQPIAYHRSLAKAVNSVTAAIFLGQLLYWLPRSQDVQDGWIWKTTNEMFDETALTRTEQESARRRLKELGVLEEQRRGLPARLHYRIDLDRLTQLLAVLPKRTPGGDGRKGGRADGEIEAGEQTVQSADLPPTSSRSFGNPVCGKSANWTAELPHTNTMTTSETTAEITHHHGERVPAQAAPAPEHRVDDDDLVSLLVERGVTTRAARRLVAQQDAEVIRTQVAYFDFRAESHSPQLGKNPAGFLRRAIEDDFPEPPGYVDPALRAEKKRRAEDQAQAEAEEQARRERAQLDADAAEHATPPQQRARSRVESWRRMAKIAGRDFSQTEAEERFTYYVELFTKNAEAFFFQHPEYAHLRADPETDKVSPSSQSARSKKPRKAKTAAPEAHTAPENGREVAEDHSNNEPAVAASQRPLGAYFTLRLDRAGNPSPPN